MTSRRENTIKYAVPNLRYRWPEELKPYTDDAIAEVYENFSLSDEFGNNDEKFPEWFKDLENASESPDPDDVVLHSSN